MRFDAIVLGLSGTGLAVARALGRRGYRVAGVDPRRWEIGHRSRYVVSCTEQTVDAVRRLAADTRPVMYVCGDPQLDWACKHAAELAPLVRLPESVVNGAAATALDKRAMYRRCAELNIQMPTTWFPQAGSLPRVPFPVLVKPPCGGGKPRLARNRAELVDAAPRPEEVVLQALIPGVTTQLWVAAFHLSAGGDAGPVVVAQKERQAPGPFGSGARVRVRRDDEVKTRSIALARALGLSGPVGAEWKRFRGRLHLIEINARPVLWYALCGSVIDDAQRELTGRGRGVEAPPADGTRWRYVERDPMGPSADVNCLGAPDDRIPGLLGGAYTAALAVLRATGRR